MSAIASPTPRPGGLKVAVEEIKARRGPAPWSERDRRERRVCGGPSSARRPATGTTGTTTSSRGCWYVHEGELSWTMEGEAEPITVGAGEWILAPANAFHLIQVLGDRPAIRVAVSVAGEPHRHERENKPPTPPGARADFTSHVVRAAQQAERACSSGRSHTWSCGRTWKSVRVETFSDGAPSATVRAAGASPAARPPPPRPAARPRPAGDLDLLRPGRPRRPRPRTGIGRTPTAITWPSTLTARSPMRPRRTFMAGVPMNVATNMSTGWS